jgi:hypothetical protein
VTVGAAASDAAGEFSMEAIFDGIGVARYGSLVGSAHAEASSKPASSFLAGGEIIVDVGFTDGAEVVSDTLAEGTPVTLTFRMTLDASAMHFTDGKGLNPPDTGAAARHEVEVRDLDDVTVPFGQGALVVNSIGDNERLRTFEFDTAVGHRIELEAHLILGAGVMVNHPLYAFTEGEADVLAGNTAELFHEPSGGVRLVADSGHDYAAPEPGRGLLLAFAAAAVWLRRSRWRRAAAAVALAGVVPSLAAAAELRATSLHNALAGNESTQGSSSLTPGPASLDVTAGATAADSIENPFPPPDAWEVEALGLASGTARYGSLAGVAHAEASSLPGDPGAPWPGSRWVSRPASPTAPSWSLTASPRARR